MALPSSPPNLPMAMEVEIPSSPPLPALAVPPSRKRQLSEFESNISSDPLFSEGTTDSEDADFDRPRRKRMVKMSQIGHTGWRSMGKRPQRQGSVLNEDGRNADSGVWMGSDGSELSSASLCSNQRRLQALRVTSTSTMGLKSTATAMRPAGRVTSNVREQIAQDIINDCVEEGKEAVDLSRLDLQTLSSETLRPLHQLIRHAHISMTEPPSEDQFAALTPELKLFLAGNQLTSLPSELFLLENMTVLSLRNNLLPELPYSIGRLKSLKELNIAGNQIRLLPFELLSLLGSRKQINIRPNPLIEIDGLSTSQKPQGETQQDEDMLDDISVQEDSLRTRLHARFMLGRLRHTQELEERRLMGETHDVREELIHLAASSVRYFNVVGTPCQRPDESYKVVFDAASAPSSSRKAPSLFELALQCAQNECDLEALPEGIPASVSAGLSKAAKAIDAGNQECTTCKRSFIIPRAEWVEFWFRGPVTQAELTPEAVMPFLRRACSWSCAEPTAAGGFL